MAGNEPLQQRAGRNIGVEVLPPYIHDAAMPEIAVNPTGMTVIMEGQPNVVRTPSVRVFAGNFGLIINKTTQEYQFDVLFVDDQNNEIPIGRILVPGETAKALNPEGVGQELFAQGFFLGLCPGEKIILRGSIPQ